MNELAKYEKMLKDNNAAIKKLQMRGKVIASIIKSLKDLGEDDKKPVEPEVASTLNTERVQTEDLDG